MRFSSIVDASVAWPPLSVNVNGKRSLRVLSRMVSSASQS
jgi:hypothetical protein